MNLFVKCYPKMSVMTMAHIIHRHKTMIQIQLRKSINACRQICANSRPNKQHAKTFEKTTLCSNYDTQGDDCLLKDLNEDKRKNVGGNAWLDACACHVCYVSEM